MPSFLITDARSGVYADSLEVGPESLGLSTGPAAWRITKRRLQGGRRDGVDLIRLDNGALVLEILPTRGMGIWRGSLRGDRVGWDSPVGDGPVHPVLVNLAGSAGLGWLDGFDEMMVRCGLTHNGAPYNEGQMVYPLHGRIANIPAHHVSVSIDEEPPHALTVEGHVDETRLFGPRLRLATSITTVPGSNRATVRDVFQNLGDQAADLQILYHWNFGPPHLEEGSRLVAPVKTVAPRDARAQKDMGTYPVYGPPQIGYAEQVYFFQLHGAGADGDTVVLLRHPSARRGLALRFSTRELPCFTLWKNTGGLRDGYVTGLEPATNYPNPKPFEKEKGRVITLQPGESYSAATTLEVLDDAEGVAAIEEEIKGLQSLGRPVEHPGPTLPFSAP